MVATRLAPHLIDVSRRGMRGSGAISVAIPILQHTYHADGSGGSTSLWRCRHLSHASVWNAWRRDHRPRGTDGPTWLPIDLGRSRRTCAARPPISHVDGLRPHKRRDRSPGQFLGTRQRATHDCTAAGLRSCDLRPLTPSWFWWLEELRSMRDTFVGRCPH